MSVPRGGRHSDPPVIHVDGLNIRCVTDVDGEWVNRGDLVRWLRVCITPKRGPLEEQLSTILDAMADMIADRQGLALPLTRALDDLIDTAIQVGRDSRT